MKIKRLIGIIITISCFYSCTPIAKIQLPYSETSRKIYYEKEVETTLDKGENYNSLIKEIFTLCPKATIKDDNKTEGHFQIMGYSTYLYGEDKRTYTYLINCTITNNKCHLLIDNIRMLNKPIETLYFDPQKNSSIRLNNAYPQINKKTQQVLDDLVKQLK
jgi:hypothetical protein